MSEFPEIQPFGPRPVQSNEDLKNEAKSVSPPEPVNSSAVAPSQRRPPIALVLSALTVGFALGYAASRYQHLLLRQSKIDEFIDYAQAWIREQGPKIADPIKRSLESTGSSVEQAIKKVSASVPLESLNLLQRPKPRKFLGIQI
jgi:hypothetical protein